MTIKEAIKVLKNECYVFNPLNFDRTTLINTALDNCIEIPEGATNGDILKAIFNIKDEQITEGNLFISVSEFDCSKDNFCNPHDFFKTWWNAPYKKGDKE